MTPAARAGLSPFNPLLPYMYPKPLCIQSKMAGSWHATAGLSRPSAAADRDSRRMVCPAAYGASGGFYPARQPLSRTGTVPGNRYARATFSPEPETTVTKPASAAATLAAPCPSLFSDSGSLAQNLVEAFLDVRDETERRAAPLIAGGSADPVDAGRQPGEMAPRPYHLVLRAIPARRALPGLPAVSPGLRLPVQFLLRQRRTAPRPPPARPSDPPGRRRSHRLSPACRRRRGEILPDRRRGHAGEAGAAGRSRPQSRAAASGIDADRHPARLRAKPDSAGLRPGVALSRLDAAEATNGSALNEGIHTIGHAGDSFHFDNEKPAHRALVGPVKLARNLVTNAEWLAFMADGGYATPTLWLMDGFAAASNERMAGARPLAPDRRRMADHDAGRVAAGRSATPRSAMSAITRPTRSRAGAASICRPKWNGKSPPAPASSTTPSGSCGNGPAAPMRPIPATAPSKARSANTTASSWSTSWCCAARRLQPRQGHSRVTYRNFFYPHHRWQFTGLRLADYAA